MGAPSSPTIMSQPSKSEKDAAKAALQEKKDALASIRQDVFARSQGLRGAASMYDFAGPTPHLAADPKPTMAQPPPTVTKPPPPPPNPWGKSNTTAGPVNDFAHNPFPADPNPSRGPRGDRDPLSRTIGGAPKNTGAVPGGPLLNQPYGGSPRESGLPPTPARTALPGSTNIFRTAAGLGPITAPAKPAVSPDHFQNTASSQMLKNINAQRVASGQAPITGKTSTQPANMVADSYVKPQPPVTKPGAGLAGLKTVASGTRPGSTAPTAQSIVTPPSTKLGGTPSVAAPTAKLTPVTPPAPPPTTAKLSGIVGKASIIPQSGGSPRNR
jgi:hypothetical protein